MTSISRLLTKQPPLISITGALMSTLSFPSQTGGERKTVTFDRSLLSIPPRGIKRSIEEDLYLGDPDAKRGRLPEYITVSVGWLS